MFIDSVHARVVLPDGVTPTRTAVYTGARGSIAKDAKIEKPGKTFSRIEDSMLVLGYERGGYIRETWVRPHGEGAQVAEDRIVFTPTIAPVRWRTVSFTVSSSITGASLPPSESR